MRRLLGDSEGATANPVSEHGVGESLPGPPKQRAIDSHVKAYVYGYQRVSGPSKISPDQAWGRDEDAFRLGKRMVVSQLMNQV